MRQTAHFNLELRAREALAIVMGLWGASGLTPAAAQEARTDSTRSAVLDEVVVTAQKREESLYKVPISMSALTEEMIAKNDIVDLNDLQLMVPGLQMQAASLGGGIIFLRGIGNFNAGAGADGTVAVHLDGVYVPRPVVHLFELSDVQRVEALRGPQGTLYGRNATAGVINIISQPPTEEFSGKAEVRFGSYDDLQVNGAISGPLVEDRVLVRLSATRHTKDDFMELNNQDFRRRQKDVTAVRGSMLFRMTDDADLNLIAYHLKDDAQGVFPIKQTNPRGLLAVFGAQVIPDDFVIGTDLEQADRINVLEMSGVTASLTVDLGSVALTSISAWQDSKSQVRADNDFTEVPINISDFNEDSETLTQELRLTSEYDSRLQWIVGAYYLDKDANGFTEIVLPALSLTAVQIDEDIDTEAYAAFGEATYSFTDGLRVRAGVRYNHETKENFQTNFGAVMPLSTGTVEWSAVTPRLVFEYEPAANWLTYASASRGFKSGGFNSFGDQEGYDPEYIWSYEVGAKGTGYDGRLQGAVSVFHYDYEDLQVFVPLPGVPGTLATVIENAATATGQGIELELTAAPTDAFAVTASAAWLDTEYGDWTTINTNSPTPTVPVNVAGNTLMLAPEFTSFIAPQYTIPLGQFAELVLRGEWRYQSKVWFSQFSVEANSQDAYSIFNAQVTLVDQDKRWNASVYANNIGDERTLNFSQSNANGDALVWAPPDEYGIKLSYRF